MRGRETKRATVIERDREGEWTIVRQGRGKQREGERPREDPKTYYAAKRKGQIQKGINMQTGGKKQTSLCSTSQGSLTT